MSAERCPRCNSDQVGPAAYTSVRLCRSCRWSWEPDAFEPRPAPPQDGDEIETAFETLKRFIAGRVGPEPAALTTIRTELERLRTERDEAIASSSDWHRWHGEEASRAERAEAALRALRSVMEKPEYASREALDQWMTVAVAALSPETPERET